MPDALARLSNALSDRYRIERELGAGGMATVYLAHDVKHDREVAVKVLRPELAAVIGADRFLSEIKTTANLQHPHILPLHDSGEVDGTLFYVMPYVEGVSLRDRISHEHQLPVAEAVRIASEVADALQYAHDHGVIHRDIKPENILLQGGHALVADFGIALAVSTAGTRMTETGMSLGTPHYMSPEQAMGEREITARSDVYALGAVLYEMLAGEPPFTGPTAQAIVARVVTETPRSLIPNRHTVPPNVDAAVLTALEKLPADRFGTARAFADALASPQFTRSGTVAVSGAGAVHAAGAGPARRRSRFRDPVVVGLGAVTVASLAFGAFMWRHRPAPADTPVIRFLYTGSDSAPITDPPPWPAAISPDGSMLVFSVLRPDGSSMLELRRSDQLDAHPIPGTTNASQPLFSPDGKWLAFEADNKEKKVLLDGSAPVTITAGGFDNGADWTTTGVLVVGSTGNARGLSKVSVGGGDLTPVTHPDTGKNAADHLWPVAFPDGKTVAFVIWHGALSSSELALASLDGGAVTPLGLKGIRPLVVLDGALLYVKEDGTVMAVPVNERARKVTGAPVPVHDPVQVTGVNNGNSSVFVSRGGALVVGEGTDNAQLMSVDRKGQRHVLLPAVRSFSQPRLSPDGRRLAVEIADDQRTDVWLFDLQQGVLSRLTNTQTVAAAEWTADGKAIVFASSADSMRGGIWRQAVTQALPPRLLLASPNLVTQAVPSPDGKSLLYGFLGPSSFKLARVPLDSISATRPFASSPGLQAAPAFSPDGHWVALTSDETGKAQVYIRSYPDPTVKLQASVSGGAAPEWSADGKRLYYVAGNAIMEARVETAPTLRVVSRDTAFANIPTPQAYFGTPNYTVTRDGLHVITLLPKVSTYRLIVVPNWLREFRQRMATAK